MNLNARQLWYINAVLAAIVLWLVYAIWLSPKKDAWQFIPDNAFLVIESSKIQRTLYDQTDTVATSLEEIPFLNDAVLRLKDVVKDLDLKTEVQPFLNGKLISYSVHREAKSNLEFITYIPLRNDDTYLKAILSNNAKSKRAYTQTTNDVDIVRVRPNDKNAQEFAYFLQDDYMICSRSVLLLEAAISKMQSRTPTLDKMPFKESRRQAAHFYFRTDNLLDVSDLLPSRLSPNLRSYFRNITPFNPDLVFNEIGKNGNLGGYIDGNSKIKVPFISAFSTQRSSAFTSARLIPENTAFFLRTSFNDGPALGLQLNVYLKAKDKLLYSQKDSVNTLLERDVDDIFKYINKEAILCEMETTGGENAQRVALFHTSKPENLTAFMQDLVKSAEGFQPFKVLPFSLFNRVVQKLEIAEFPALFFGSSFSGFSECYYAVWQNYLIVANSQIAMEAYLNRINTGQTWQTSTKHLELQRRLNKNAQVTAVISPPQIWNNIYYSLPEKWQKSVLNQEASFKNMRVIAIENFSFKDKFGSKVHILKGNLGRQRFSNQLLLQSSIELSTPIMSAPRILLNAETQTEEVLLATPSAFVLYDANHKKINELPLEDKPTSTDEQTNFYRNGALQTVMHTDHKVMVAERQKSGVNVRTLPLTTEGIILAIATDPGQIFVATATGEIYRITAPANVTKIPLKKAVGQITDIALTRLNNQLLLAVTESDGTLQLFYPNTGVAVKGFPMIAVQGRPVKILPGFDNQDDPLMQIVTESGAIETVDIRGERKAEAAVQLERRSRNAFFDVVYNAQKRDWLLIQKDPSGVIIYDRRGQQLIEIDTPYYRNLNVKYFDLGNDLRIISIFDGKTTLLYDLQGHQIGDKPLEATAPPFISFEANFSKLLIYNPNGNVLEKWGVKVE